MYNTTVLVFALSAVAGCWGNTFQLGACPRVIVMKDLDFDRFLGDWYVIQRFNPMATCTKLTFEKAADGTYSLNETARPLGISFNLHTPYLKARKLHFLRNDTNSIFRAERNFAHFTLSTFGVIDTDYDNYALVWGCDPVLFGSIQNVDLLSRQQSLEPDVIKSAKEKLKDLSISFAPMDNVDQSRCSDTDSSSDESRRHEDTNNIVTN